MRRFYRIDSYKQKTADEIRLILVGGELGKRGLSCPDGLYHLAVNLHLLLARTHPQMDRQPLRT